MVAAYYLAPARARAVVLLIGSYVFYAAWDVRFLPLVIGLTLANFWLGQRLALAHGRPNSRRWLWAAVALNLAVLGFFKYTLFALFNAERVLELGGIRIDLPEPSIILPLAISFFTFEFIHYLVDVHRGHPPVRSLVEFALFPAFFPTQIAGPIKRYQGFLPQIHRATSPTWDNARAGVTLIVIGLFKKSLLADNLALITNIGFGHASGGLVQIDAVTTVLAFTFQIYFDFSGYTDMGRGSARLLGFDVPENFQRPYMATNISEFWRRWHITLSSWLRDYVYIPLGGNRRRRTANLLVTMLLGGLWHGASTTFLVWGGLHGLLLAGYWHAVRLFPWFRTAAPTLSPLRGFAGWLFTFTVVCLAWVFFRAETTKDGLSMVMSVAGLRPGQPLFLPSQHAFVLAVAVLALVTERWLEWRAARGMLHADAPAVSPNPTAWWQPAMLAVALTVIFAVTLVFSPSNAPKFVYFQF